MTNTNPLILLAKSAILFSANSQILLRWITQSISDRMTDHRLETNHFLRMS